VVPPPGGVLARPGTTATASSLGAGLIDGLVVGLGEADAVTVGVAVGVAVGAVVGAAANGATVGFGVGRVVGRGVGLGVGRGVGRAVGSGVGGAEIVTVPAEIVSENRLRLIAAIEMACEPTGNRPAQRNVTPRFQSVPLVRAIVRVDPATVTRTQSAGDPSRFRYPTVIATVVVVVPERGDADGSERRVGPGPAHAGATANRRRRRTATIDAPIRACHRPGSSIMAGGLG
jgi:hypothetical protein